LAGSAGVILWRISRHRELNGAGGLRAPGRWHHAGQPVVYLAASPAAALLEVCAHTSANDVPPDFTLLKVEGPAVKIETIHAQYLPADWLTNLSATRERGTAWLRKGGCALLRVPSAIVPETENFVLNPVHPDAAKFRITDVFLYPFDLRLKK
jgi:RES domain-containing protein